MSDFLSALDGLTDAPITHALLARLSGASRSQGTLFAERITHLPEVRRLEIVASMVYHAGEDFMLDFSELYRACLGDASPLVRRQAVEGLWLDERPDLAPRLIQILREDPSADVRAAAASSLGRFVWLAEIGELGEARGQQVREALEQCIGSEQEPVEVRRRAVEAIAFINDMAVRQIIDRAYADEDSLMRTSALFAMGRNADPFWAETVRAEMHNDAPALRYEAVRACGGMSLTAAAPTLVRILGEERDQEIRLMAIWSLGQIGGPRVRRVLERLLESDDEALAEAASEALDEMDMMDPSFDLMMVGLEDQGVLTEEDLEALEAEGFRSAFHRYVDEDEQDSDQQDDDEEWPDEFLEIG